MIVHSVILRSKNENKITNFMFLTNYVWNSFVYPWPSTFNYVLVLLSQISNPSLSIILVSISKSRFNYFSNLPTFFSFQYNFVRSKFKFTFNISPSDHYAYSYWIFSNPVIEFLNFCLKICNKQKTVYFNFTSTYLIWRRWNWPSGSEKINLSLNNGRHNSV